MLLKSSHLFFHLLNLSFLGEKTFQIHIWYSECLCVYFVCPWDQLHCYSTWIEQYSVWMDCVWLPCMYLKQVKTFWFFEIPEDHGTKWVPPVLGTHALCVLQNLRTKKAMNVFRLSKRPHCSQNYEIWTIPTKGNKKWLESYYVGIFWQLSISTKILISKYCMTHF